MALVLTRKGAAAALPIPRRKNRRVVFNLGVIASEAKQSRARNAPFTEIASSPRSPQ
jgi:hypothetical protein